MKTPITIKLAFTLSFLFAFVTLFAQIPEGGILLNTSSGQKVGSCTVTQVNVTDQPFTKAIRCATVANIGNFRDAQIQFPTVAGIATNDVILMAFWARTISTIQESGEGALTVIIEHRTTYDKEISRKVLIGSEWKQYYASAKSKVTWSTSDVRYALFTGYSSQTIEVADVQFLNYKNSISIEDLPVTEITYAGQAADAAWRADAQERINQIRKGIVDIVVFDENGQSVKDAEVSIEMVKHKFGFGSAIPANVFVNNTIFRNKVFELFNEVIFENDLKWPQFNPGSTYNIRRSLDSLDAHGIAVRGHNVIWPSWRFSPSSIKSLESNPVVLRAAKNKKPKEKITVQIKWFLPSVLHEISGICWIDEQRLACIQDELGVIYIYNISSAKIENQIPFAGPGDFESITKADDTYFVMRSDGKVFEIKMSPSKNPTVTQYDLPFDKMLDFEGFFYDKTKKQLLITFKQSDPKTGAKAKEIYAFDPVKKTMDNKPVYVIDLSSKLLNRKDDDIKDKDLYKNFFPSDVAINPVTSDIYLTDGINCSLLIIDKIGKMKSHFKLDKDGFPQPEGITFSPKGDLFLSSEGLKHSGIIARVIIETESEKEKMKYD